MADTDIDSAGNHNKPEHSLTSQQAKPFVLPQEEWEDPLGNLKEKGHVGGAYQKMEVLKEHIMYHV